MILRILSIAGVMLTLGLYPGVASTTVTNGPGMLPSGPISLADAINLALKQNAQVLRAQQDLELTRGLSVQTRAVYLPKVRASGSYTAVESDSVDSPDFLTLPGLDQFTFGTPQNWGTQLRVVQSIYEGGRLTSSSRTARLIKEQSMFLYQTVVADTILDVHRRYYAVLLARENITVREQSVQLLTRELQDTRNRFEAGTVPRFNVLRAEVELANAQPPLIRARNYLRITRNELVNVLGITLPLEKLEEVPLQLSGTLDTQPYEVDLPKAVETALERRTELLVFGTAEKLRQEDLVSARSRYYPGLQAFGGYDAKSSMFDTDLTEVRHGWIAGVQMNWDIFDGGLTRGRVIEAQARRERAAVDTWDARRRIELEVRTAYSGFIEAREVLASQTKVEEQAEEALRLAHARNTAGTGTQLDVLSAQTALTEARTTRIEAQHGYVLARARLERAMGINVTAAPDPK